MALAVTTVWEVRTAGSDTLCSGGFVAGGGGTDYSQQDAAQYTGTNLVIDGAVNTKVTSATHNFVAADVGNLMQITAGSGFTTGFFQIVSVAANAATLDRSAGTLGSTAGTFAVGGALATAAAAFAAVIAGNTIYAKGGYTTTTNTFNVAGGRVGFPSGGTWQKFTKLIGYTTTRTDGGKYTITLGATFTGPVLDVTTIYADARNIAIVGNATSASTAMLLTGRNNSATNIKISGFNAGGASIATVANEAVLKDFEISGGATGSSASLLVTSSCTIMDGWIHGNAGRGLFISSDAVTTIIRVASCDHTGASGSGFYDAGNAHSVLFGCVAWNNSTSDYNAAQGMMTLVRCVSGGSAQYNFETTDPNTVDSMRLFYCAAKTDTLGLYQAALTTNVGLVTLTGDPFTNRAAGDFSLNNTAGAGAACRGIAEVLFGLTTTYRDTGIAQHQDAGGGGAGGTGPNVIVSSGAGSRGGSW